MSGRHESWEFDSGARDLSPEPHSLQKLVEAAAGGTGNMLDLANKVSRDDLSFSLETIFIFLILVSPLSTAVLVVYFVHESVNRLANIYLSCLL